MPAEASNQGEMLFSRMRDNVREVNRCGDPWSAKRYKRVGAPRPHIAAGKPVVPNEETDPCAAGGERFRGGEPQAAAKQKT